MMPKLLPLVAALLALTGCASPLLSSSSPQHEDSPRAPGTAKLVITTPYGNSRSLAVYQGTVEPQNLLSAVHEFHVTLASAEANQTIGPQTFSVDQAASFVVTGLYQADDWVLTVEAVNSSFEVIGQYTANQNISTVAGQTTVWGDIVLAPLAADGSSSPFTLQLIDLPSSISPLGFDYTVEAMDSSGTLSEDTGLVNRTAVTAIWQNRGVTLSGTLATGTYRVVLKFKDKNGQAALFSPTFLVHLYPRLASTKTFSAKAWNKATSAPDLSLQSISPATSGLTITWTATDPDEADDAYGYEWYWYPGTLGYPVGSPESVPSTVVRSGFIVPAPAGVSRAYPSWTLEAGSTYDTDYATSTDWRLYVRSVTPEGKVGTWFYAEVHLALLTFPVQVSAMVFTEFPDEGDYRLVKTQEPAAGHPFFASEPILAKRSFSVTNAMVGSIVNFDPPNRWFLSGTQSLTVIAPDGSTIPVDVRVDRSHPGRTLALQVYQAISSDTDWFVALADPLPTLAPEDWMVDFGEGGPVQGWVYQDSVVAPTSLPEAVVSYQFATFEYSGGVGNLSLDYATTMFAETWTDLAWPYLANEAQVKHVLVRPVFDDGSTTVYGEWGLDTVFTGIDSLTPQNVTWESGTLSWDEWDWTSWGGAEVIWYDVYRNGTLKTNIGDQSPYSRAQVDTTQWGPGNYTIVTKYRRVDGFVGYSEASASVMATDYYPTIELTYSGATAVNLAVGDWYGDTWTFHLTDDVGLQTVGWELYDPSMNLLTSGTDPVSTIDANPNLDIYSPPVTVFGTYTLRVWVTDTMNQTFYLSDISISIGGL